MIYLVVKKYSYSVQNIYICYVGATFTGCFIFNVGTFNCRSNYVLWGYCVRQRSYKQNVFIFCIWFVVGNFITVHSMNVVLGHTVKTTYGIANYKHLFEE
jgi:hypothetical protein